MDKQKRQRKKKRKAPKPPTKLSSKKSKIIMPRKRSLYRPASPFEQRMVRHPLSTMPPLGSPEMKALEERMKHDVLTQAYIAKKIQRLPIWMQARSLSGSGFLMSDTLRWFFAEYFNRQVTMGPNAMPTSFRVIESFLKWDEEFLVYHVPDELEHLLFADDYFQWYSQTDLPREPKLLMDVMKEGAIYSYDMAGDYGGYRITGTESEFVLAGISLVRHSNELSVLLVAGENPGNPPDDQIAGKLEGYTPVPGRESLKPAPELDTKDRYLDRYPDFARIHIMTRFDLKANRYSVRYVNVDVGSSYIVYSDDPSIFDELHLTKDEIDERISGMCELMPRYDALYSALSTLMFLPAAFIAMRDLTSTTSFKTEIYALRNNKDVKEVIDEFDDSVYKFERQVVCLKTQFSANDPSTKKIIPPELDVQQDGYWMNLVPGEFGKDQDGNKIAGRTWVSRLDTWSAQSPSDFLLEKAITITAGKDPGIVYVVRSASHELEIYKVGLTRKSAESRVSDLSKTSAPLPFNILAQWEVGNCLSVEQEAHKRLNVYRINPKREFFRCPLQTIVETIHQVIADLG